MKNVAASGVVVILDGTAETAAVVAELSQAGKAVTAVGTTFAQVVSVLTGDVYALVADVTDPEQWATAMHRAQLRHGAVERIIDPSGLLVAPAA